MVIYRLTKLTANLAFRFIVKIFYTNIPDIYNSKGPFLIASNHPNSFLDAMIIGMLFKEPVHFLTRGDAFNSPLKRKILASLNMIPIYRLSEGKENLGLNDKTFKLCQEVFKNNGVVLIFAEGLSINEWKLRSLKKGPARLAAASWKSKEVGSKLRVLPLSLNYNSFHRFYKTVFVEAGNFIEAKDFETIDESGAFIQQFNQKLFGQLQPHVLHLQNDSNINQLQFAWENIDQLTPAPQKNGFNFLKKTCHILNDESNERHPLKTNFKLGDYPISLKSNDYFLSLLLLIVLLIPAMVGFVINAPVYYFFRNFARKKTPNSVFFDSVMGGLLMVIYPLFVIILCTILALALHLHFILLFVTMPLTGFCFIKWRYALMKILNSNKLTAKEKSELLNL